MKKRKYIYIILAVIAFVAAVSFVLFPRNNKPTEARVDITTTGIKTPRFNVYVDNSETPEEQAAWMNKFDIQGYVVQSDNGVKDIDLKVLNNADIEIILRGPDNRDENNNIIENWVKYTSFTVDGQEILKEPINVWHNRPFRYTIKTKAGDEHKIHIEWTKSDQ